MTALTIGLVVLVIIAVGGMLIMAYPRRRRDVRGLYTEGLDYLLLGNLKRAYQCFKEVIEKDADHISAYLKMGQVMRRGGATEKALKLHDSLQVRPNLTGYERLELYKNLALDYSALGHHDRAVEWALAILKLEKRNTWALRHLVMFSRDLGDWTAGGKYLAQWQKVTHNEDTRLQALCRFRQGYDHRHDEAPETVRAHYKQALKIDERFTPAHYYLAESFADEAAALRHQSTTDEGATGEAASASLTELADKITNLTTQALDHWSSYVELAPMDTYRVLHRVEESLFSLQRFDDVEPFLRQVLDKQPENLDGLASLANFYVRKGELDKAKQLLDTIPEDAASGPFIRAIQLKLGYRRDASQNMMPELDRLIDSIRINAQAQVSPGEAQTSLMSWLEPNNDPLENLA